MKRTIGLISTFRLGPNPLTTLILIQSNRYGH
jgi:hypothetical protein